MNGFLQYPFRSRCPSPERRLARQKTQVLRILLFPSIIHLINALNAFVSDVTEGYSTTRFGRSPSSPAKLSGTSNPAVFRSANDTLQAVFSSLPSGQSPSISPKKRARQEESEYELGEIDENDDTEMRSGSDGEYLASIGHDIGHRPVKPLRKPRRSLLETNSLPTGYFQFSGQHADAQSANMDTMMEEKSTEEEEDWSTLNSSSSQFQPMGL